MTDRATAAVVIFARHPSPGKVKTRLAKDTGAEAAALFYKTCAEHVIAQALRCSGCTCYLFFSLPEEEGQVKTWLVPLGEALVMRPQLQSPVLGDRMYDAMASCLSAGHSKVLIVGTDVPDLNSDIIEGAVAALDHFQLVFGPAEDGGYYLMGATAMPPRIFQGIQWSTSTVLESSLANARRLGLGVAPLATLPTLADIDTVADLQRWLDGAGGRGSGGLAAGGGAERQRGSGGANGHPCHGVEEVRVAAAAALEASCQWRRQLRR